MAEEKPNESVPPEKEEEQKTEEPDIVAAAKKRKEELDNMNKDLQASIKEHDRLVAESIMRGKAFAGQKERTVQDDIRDESEALANTMGRTFKK